MKRLQSLYNHLQSDYPNLPGNLAGNPEALLSKLLMAATHGEGLATKGGLFFLDSESSEEPIDWEMAYDEGEELWNRDCVHWL